MKKYLLMTAMILALAAPAMAQNQNPPGNWNQQGGPGGAQGGAGGEGEHFQEHKAEILRRMNEHLAETQQRIRCVEAAGNHEALRACMPERGGQGGGQAGGEGGPPRQ